MADGDTQANPDGTITWSELLAEVAAALRLANIDNAVSEARWMVEQATDTRGSAFHEVLSTLATVRAVSHLDAMVRRRCSGEPLQYVLGSWSFRSLDLMVDQRVLIPRPETEVVVGLALDELDRLRPNGGGTVIDLGTGSGAIGLSIAAERPVSRVLLTDASADALAVARANLAGLGLAGRSVEICQGSWFDAIPERFLGECDVIVSNPPYVRTTDPLPSEVGDWEPQGALLSGETGLDDILVIVADVTRWLRPLGAVVIEMDPAQTATVQQAFVDLGFDATVRRDLAGRDRAVVARRGT